MNWCDTYFRFQKFWAYGQVWHYKVLWMICSPNDGIDGFYFFRLTRSIWPFDNNPVSIYFHWIRALEIKHNLASKSSIWGDPLEKKMMWLTYCCCCHCYLHCFLVCYCMLLDLQNFILSSVSSVISRGDTTPSIWDNCVCEK